MGPTEGADRHPGSGLQTPGPLEGALAPCGDLPRKEPGMRMGAADGTRAPTSPGGKEKLSPWPRTGFNSKARRPGHTRWPRELGPSVWGGGGRVGRRALLGGQLLGLALGGRGLRLVQGRHPDAFLFQLIVVVGSLRDDPLGRSTGGGCGGTAAPPPPPHQGQPAAGPARSTDTGSPGGKAVVLQHLRTSVQKTLPPLLVRPREMKPTELRVGKRAPPPMGRGRSPLKQH